MIPVDVVLFAGALAFFHTSEFILAAVLNRELVDRDCMSVFDPLCDA